ncbi:MGMT family protein [Haliea sp. E17]|uniref:MGMT family protein n=1 Tax=Haliea sp. E17 TaxID=3401576 RepID=UPI003AAE43D5
MRHTDNDERIWQVVALIPEGKVATYGDVAAQAGLPGAARRVGAALKKLPEGTKIPWHRVINAGGRISLPPGSDSYRRQLELLRAEGITLRESGAIDLRRHRMLPA